MRQSAQALTQFHYQNLRSKLVERNLCLIGENQSKNATAKKFLAGNELKIYLFYLRVSMNKGEQ